MSQIWALHDSDPKNNPMVRIKLTDAHEFNKKGYGIFHTVNEFNGPRRIENLTHINAWAVDIDDGTKQSMYLKIIKGPLAPSVVIETKRGFQVYWLAKDAKPEHWNALVADRLVPYYGADKNARDLARILRRPGFYHMKDPNDPFLIRVVYENLQTKYYEKDIALFYPKNKITPSARALHKTLGTKLKADEGFWENVFNLNCYDCLQKLSGTDYVNGDVYDFKQNNSGTLQIYVNGKSTACWIDVEGKIGSLDKGGPTIAQWLYWYNHDWKLTINIIEREFSECKSTKTLTGK